MCCKLVLTPVYIQQQTQGCANTTILWLFLSVCDYSVTRVTFIQPVHRLLQLLTSHFIILCCQHLSVL